jgi:hypothetical protein
MNNYETNNGEIKCFFPIVKNDILNNMDNRINPKDKIKEFKGNGKLYILATLSFYALLFIGFIMIFTGTISYFLFELFGFQVILGRIIFTIATALILLKNLLKYNMKNTFICLIYTFLIIIVILLLIDVALLLAPDFFKENWDGLFDFLLISPKYTHKDWKNIIRAIFFFYRFIFDTVVSFITCILLFGFEIYLINKNLKN